MKNWEKEFIKYWGEAQGKEGYVHRDAVIVFFKEAIQKEITELLMSMPLEKMRTKAGEYESTATNIEKFGYNNAIQEIKDWRDKILK